MAKHPHQRTAEEIAVLGGGLAGLSLVLQLLDHGIGARITIVEPRATYTDDRTWCFWDTDAHPFRHLIADRWPTWHVHDRTRTYACRGTYAYARLSAGDVYAHALDRIAQAPNVRLWRGTRVQRLNGRRVQTDAGTLDADLVYDGRPPRLPETPSGPRLLQQFVGRRICTDRDTFDPGACQLMDFRLPQDHGIAFLYVLPRSPREALVEATVFAATRLPAGRLDTLLDDALAARLPGTVETLGSERGAIPMVPNLGERATSPGVIPIGTRAGAPRGSTGYAFLPIQRHSRALAARHARGDPGPVRMRGRLTDWLDRVFLARLIARPDAAPADFGRLFARVRADRLVRFLMERGGPLDHLAVMAALPTGAFLRHAAAVSLPRALRPRSKGAARFPAPDADPERPARRP
jgi:lycopene beta-cyclase